MQYTWDEVKLSKIAMKSKWPPIECITRQTLNLHQKVDFSNFKGLPMIYEQCTKRYLDLQSTSKIMEGTKPASVKIATCNCFYSCELLHSMTAQSSAKAGVMGNWRAVSTTSN